MQVNTAHPRYNVSLSINVHEDIASKYSGVISWGKSALIVVKACAKMVIINVNMCFQSSSIQDIRHSPQAGNQTAASYRNCKRVSSDLEYLAVRWLVLSTSGLCKYDMSILEAFIAWTYESISAVNEWGKIRHIRMVPRETTQSGGWRTIGSIKPCILTSPFSPRMSLCRVTSLSNASNILVRASKSPLSAMLSSKMTLP